MLGVLLATLSGISYGASDFTGAVAAKDNNATLVTVAMQVVSLIALVAVLAVFPAEERTLEDLAWGALGGLGAAIALTTFYMALARGPMSTAASITGLVGALVPLVAGLALGDRPGGLALLGVGVSLPAVLLLSTEPGGTRAMAARATPRERIGTQVERNQTRVLALVAGLGFGLFFVSLSRTSEESGLFPLLGARVASITALALVVTLSRGWKPLSRSATTPVVIAGLLDCAANSLYVTALGEGTFVWIAAIVSLYPVATILLARIVLNEKLRPVQMLGLAGAGAALVLIAIGR